MICIRCVQSGCALNSILFFIGLIEQNVGEYRCSGLKKGAMLPLAALALGASEGSGGGAGTVAHWDQCLQSPT